MQWKKRSRASAKQTDFKTLIDEGSEIEGKFSFTGVTMVNGRLRGEIVAADSLVVGEKGVVNASIRAGVIQVWGEVVGDLTASDRVELLGHSRVYGDVEAPTVVIEEGALFEGQCRMTKGRVDIAVTPSRDRDVVPLKRTEVPR